MVSLIALASMFRIARDGAEYVTYEGGVFMQAACKQRANKSKGKIAVVAGHRHLA
jgi:hypothetical protein